MHRRQEKTFRGITETGLRGAAIDVLLIHSRNRRAADQVPVLRDLHRVYGLRFNGVAEAVLLRPQVENRTSSGWGC